MSRPALEVAEIVRRHGEAYRQTHAGALSRAQVRLLRAIALCRTARLGGHVEACDHCGYQRIAYNSCRNRHCPKCQGGERAAWLAARQADLLPVPYFHVVFTLPEPVAAMAFQNKRVIYDLLFRAATQTLRTIAADPRHLGAEIGCLAVLHTWGQTLLHHPHLHCVVPGGGLSPDGRRWVACRPGFFLPVRVLSRLFRRRFLDHLQAAFAAGDLRFHAALAGLNDSARFAEALAPLRALEWVVYAKRPFGGPEQVLAYLGRYTHRVAITNSRLVALTETEVSFRWKDYRHHDRLKTMTVTAAEFLRRFLLHVLPDGFQRLRHYGLLANRGRAGKLALCRQLLAAPAPPSVAPAPGGEGPVEDSLSESRLWRCPRCQSGHLIRIALVPVANDRERIDTS